MRYEILSRGSRFLPTNSGVKVKKHLQREILGIVCAYTRVFRPVNKALLILGGHKQYFVGGRPRNALQGHRACYVRTFFWAQSLLGGAQPVIWEHGREMPPPVAPGLKKRRVKAEL